MKEKIFGWNVKIPRVNHFTDWSFFDEGIADPFDISGPMVNGNDQPLRKSGYRHDRSIVEKRKAQLRSGESPLSPDETKYDRNSEKFGGYYG